MLRSILLRRDRSRRLWRCVKKCKGRVDDLERVESESNEAIVIEYEFKFSTW